MDLTTIINLYGVIIALILKGVPCASTLSTVGLCEHEAGTYNDNGVCQRCTICPGVRSNVNLNDWLVTECYTDPNFKCPYLCKVRSSAWPDEADDSMCRHFTHPTTTRISTTVVLTSTSVPTTWVPTTSVATTSPLKRQTPRAPAETLTPALVVNPEVKKNISEPILGWSMLSIAVAILLVLLLVVWLRRRPKPQRISDEELKLLNSEVIEDVKFTATSISITFKDYKTPSCIELWSGENMVSTKSISEDVCFDTEDGVRSQTTYTLQMCIYSKSNMEGDRQVQLWPQFTTKAILCDIINTSPTSISIKHQITNGNFRITLCDGSNQVAEKSLDTMSQNPVIFNIADGILPNKTYTLSVMELSYSNDWTEVHTTATPDLFDAPDNPMTAEYIDGNVQVQGLPSDLSSQYNCYVTFHCDCINNRKHMAWQSGDDVFKTVLEGFDWSWLQVSITTGTCIKTNVVGKTWIQRKGSNIRTLSSSECTSKFIEANQDIIKQLENVFDSKENKALREVLINIGNGLSEHDKPFKDDLPNCTSGETFVNEYLHSFKGSDVKDTDIYSLLDQLLKQLLHEQVSSFVTAVLPNHECAKCKTLVHKMLHEKGHPDSSCTSSNGSVVLPTEPSPCSSIDMDHLSFCTSSNGSVLLPTEPSPCSSIDMDHLSCITASIPITQTTQPSSTSICIDPPSRINSTSNQSLETMV